MFTFRRSLVALSLLLGSAAACGGADADASSDTGSDVSRSAHDAGAPDTGLAEAASRDGASPVDGGADARLSQDARASGDAGPCVVAPEIIAGSAGTFSNQCLVVDG